jgi:hypothetical protein
MTDEAIADLQNDLRSSETEKDQEIIHNLE